MTRPFSFFPPEASTLARKVDALFLYLTSTSVFFSVLIFGLVLAFAIRYRRKHEHERPKLIRGSNTLEITWTLIPLLITLSFFLWGAKLYFREFRPPADAMEIFVVGKQWMWKVQHPEGRREINELHVPVGKPIKLKMTSEDVIHSFYVPAFRIKMDVVPGRYTTTWFQATKTGSYHLFCAEYCGTKHSAMMGNVTVMSEEDYADWLTNGQEALNNAPTETLRARGFRLFRRFRCDTCHFSGLAAQAPDLTNIFQKRITLKGGRTVLADEHYLRESILKPQAKIVEGYDAVMPTYQDQISEEQILAIIQYLKSLSGENTPRTAQEQSSLPPEVLVRQGQKGNTP